MGFGRLTPEFTEGKKASNMNKRLRIRLIVLLMGIMLLGLSLWFSGLNPRLKAGSKKEKIPKGLKTKTEINYKFVEKFGESKKVLDNKQIYQYDDKGNQIEGASYDADGKLNAKRLWKYKYDDKGNQIEWAYYYADGKLKWKSFFKYDDKGNQIEEAKYGADGKLIGKSLYKYDDRGNQIEGALYGADGKLIGKFLPKYDDRGNLIERALYDADGKLIIDKRLYKYKYDDKGNRTEQVEYKIVERFGKAEEVPQSQTVWEYEFY